MKKKVLNICIIWSLLLVLLLTLNFKTMAAENDAGETKTITESFSAFDRAVSWEYEYSDEYFFLPSDMFHLPLARLSLGLALSAFRDTGHEEEPDDYLTAFLQDTGFEDIDTDTYDSEPTADSIAYGIGSKKIGDVTLIALAVCGGNYSSEWANNVKIGDGTLAEGFADSARKVENGLNTYLEEHPAEGDVKLWITGYSRGAGVANIAAAELTDSGRFQDVYAYLTATPRTTKEPGDYRNIFNVVAKEDPVTKIPMEDWAYRRFGTDMLLVSLKTDMDSAEVARDSATLYQEMIGSDLVLNEEINYELRNIMDYLLYVFPDSASYTRLLQPLLVDVITGSDDTENALKVLLDALSGFDAESSEQEAELKELVDYIETLLNIYVYQGVTENLPSILWDPDFGIKNLYSEHFPFKYLARIYASDDPAELFSENTAYVRLVIHGNVDAEIYDGDTLVKTVLADGTELVGGEEVAFSYPHVMCSKNQKVITLAADQSYTIRVTSKAVLPQTVVYTGNLYSGDTVRAKTDSVYYSILIPGDTLQIVTSGDGRVIDSEKSEYFRESSILGDVYSPSTAISLEYCEIAHLTISGLLTFLFYMLAFLLLQLIASIVLAIIRKKKKRERNTAFTAVWHGVNVLLFAFCEVSMWYFVPAYPILKLIPMILTLLILLVFAWKLYRKSKSRKMLRRFLCFAGALVAFGLLNGFFAGKITLVKAIVLTLIYIGFFIAALLLFRKGQDEGEADAKINFQNTDRNRALQVDENG